MSSSSDSSGGPVSIRGYLVQTLAVLLDIVLADPPFTSITLEPAHAEDQFDFVWSDSKATHAVQVKSTINEFRKPDVEAWARNMEAARTGEQCRLMLVGKCHKKLDNVKQVGSVRIDNRPLNLTHLYLIATNNVAKFLEAQRLDAGTPVLRGMIVEGLIARLLRHSTTREAISHAEFVSYLRQWIEEAPRPQRRIDIANIDRYAPADLIGREVDTQLITSAWDCAMRGEIKRTHIITFVALGGEGKTSLVAKWAASMAHQHWPGCEAAFGWSFYTQGSNEASGGNPDKFFNNALSFFGDPDAAKGSQGTYEKGKRLAELIGKRRVLLILDGLEPLQYSPTSPMPGQLMDLGIFALLKGLAANSHGLCIVTTRYSVIDLRTYWNDTALEIKLLRLSQSAGVALLKRQGVRGMPKEFTTLVEDVKGHALTLTILGSYLRDAHAGDIRKRDLVKLEEADEEELGGHAFRVIDAYVRWFERDGIDNSASEPQGRSQEQTNTDNRSSQGRRALAILRLLSLFDRPASADCLAAAWSHPAILGLTESLVGTTDGQRNTAISRLQETNMITVNRDEAGSLVTLDTHSLIRAYFDKETSTYAYDGWKEAHRRIYEHLCATDTAGALHIEEGMVQLFINSSTNPSLEDLQPLYQAIPHGCKAGKTNEAFNLVYYTRICRGQAKYTVQALGSIHENLEAIRCFFDRPWTSPSQLLSLSDQAWLLSEAAFHLRALSRLDEAIKPMQIALSMRIEQKAWRNASIIASNLSELDLLRGNIMGATVNGDAATQFIERTPEQIPLFEDRILSYSCLGAALHQWGRWTLSLERFQQAERYLSTSRDSCDYLYSLPGYKYRDMDLSQAEEWGWKRLIRHSFEEIEEISRFSQIPVLQQSMLYELATYCISISPEFDKLTDELRVARTDYKYSILCRTVAGLPHLRRWATKALSVSLQHNWLLQSALDRLSLAWIAVQETLLIGASIAVAKDHVDSAMTALRQSNQIQFYPLGLLVSSVVLRIIGTTVNSESAKENLNEAWEIAKRGPMPLFLVDIHMHRARLFFRDADYPWESPRHDLAEARRLIDQHGYWRRKEELEDAESVILNHPLYTN